MTLLAEACGRFGDAARAPELYELLAPYARRNVVIGRAASCNGSASRPPGVLAAVMGEWAWAERHLADALAMHVAMGARPFVARTQLAWGEMELARGAMERAGELLADAIVTADALGMVVVAQHARGLISAGAAGAPANVNGGH